MQKEFSRGKHDLGKVTNIDSIVHHFHLDGQCIDLESTLI